MTSPDTPRVALISFGHLHGPPPEADLTVDVRRSLRDPARAEGILDLDGRDEVVQRVVLTTPGAEALLTQLVGFARYTEVPVTIAVGCAGGRHRSVALVELAAMVLRTAGVSARVAHRDVHRPRVLARARCANS